MQAVNGRADLSGRRHELGDFLPERDEVVINGQSYLGWVVKDGSYPREVLAKLGRAYRRYMRVIAPLLVDRQPWRCLDCESLDRQRDTEIKSAHLMVSSVWTECTHTDLPEYELWQQNRAIDDAAREKAADDQDIAYQKYLTEATMVLVPGVLESEVALVPADLLEGLLRGLGYFADKDTGLEPKEEAPTDESPLPLTGDISQPDSPGSTELLQTSS